MADKIPVKLRPGAPNRLGEFEDGDTIPVSQGGTGAVDAAAARANLGVAGAGDITAHTGNTSNPHSVTAAQIGAATTTDLTNHTGLTNNPHSVTATQLGVDTSAEVTAKVDAHANLTNNPHSVTATQLGAATTTDLSNHTGNTSNPHSVTIGQIGAASSTSVSNHTGDTNNPHGVTAAQVGSPTTAQFSSHTGNTSNPHAVTTTQIGAATTAQLTSHTGNTGNPHSVTAAQVGAPTTTQFTDHTGNTSNPHSVTATQVGAVPVGEKGAANGVCPLDGSSKILPAYLPASALPLFSVVADASARLLLVVEEGDECKQLDDGSHWIYDGATWYEYPSGGSGGDVYGTSGTTVVNEIVLYSDTTGKTLGGESGLTSTGTGQINNRNIVNDGAALDAVVTAQSNHAGNTTNPHSVTAAQVGADTSAQVTAKVDAHANLTTNPHAVTAAQVGAYTTAQVDTLIAGVGGGGAGLFFCELTSTVVIDMNDPTGISVQWNVQNIIDATQFSHSIATNNHQITINEDGIYDLQYKLNGNLGSFQRKNPGAHITIGGTPNIRTKAFGFGRNSANPWVTVQNTGQKLNLSAGDVVELVTFMGGDSGVINTVAGEVTLSLTQVRKL